MFGRIPLVQARGSLLAHSLKTSSRMLAKGTVVDAAAYPLLEAAGYTEIIVARLEPDDVAEGEAATRLAQGLLNTHLRRSHDGHGRANLFAEAAGLLRLDAGKIERLNLIDESITLATLPDRSVVRPGDMIATLKIIPFAVRGDIMARAEAVIAQGPPVFVLKPFRPLVAGLILSELPHLKDAALVHTIAATEARVQAHGGTLLPPLRTPHEVAPIASAFQRLLAEQADLILISGASAVTDRQDVAPSAIVAAGGSITYFGMPVDPGNLICFGTLAGRHAVILPGCARSPRPNGFDWVLDRIFAGEEIGPEDVARMGVGGLLVGLEAFPR